MPAIYAGPEPPALTDEDLVCLLQVEEFTVEEAGQGRDGATLEVVMEVVGLLTHSQLEGLGAPTE